MEHQTPEGFSWEARSCLIESMQGLLMNKIKTTMAHPKKNTSLARNPNLVHLIDIIAEQLLPQFCMKKQGDSHLLNLMHNLLFLLASKLQSVFNSSVIRTCID